GHRHARRRIEVPAELGRGTGEVDVSGPVVVVCGNRDVDRRAAVEFVTEAAVVQGGDDPADRLGGVVLNVPHVRLDRVEPEVVDHAAQFGDALLVRGDLGAQVRDVGGRGAGREFGGAEQLDGLGLAQPGVLDE